MYKLVDSIAFIIKAIYAIAIVVCLAALAYYFYLNAVGRLNGY